ncbi:hypothetical protein ACFX1T_021619 [Malus domestica]
MTMGTTTQAYGESRYWDNRYANESESFDWYQKYQSLAPLINLYVPRHPNQHNRILVVGCGNSAFSEGMADDGYEDVVSIDISSVVIQTMQSKYSNRPHLKYLPMDVRDMRTLDSLLCGSNSRQNATEMLEEVWRVLKDKGVYFLVTYGAPLYRLRLLRESCSWMIKLHVIEKLSCEDKPEPPIWDLTNPVPLHGDGSSAEELLGNNPDVHYIYICTKDNSLKPGVKREPSVD